MTTYRRCECHVSYPEKKGGQSYQKIVCFPTVLKSWFGVYLFLNRNPHEKVGLKCVKLTYYLSLAVPSQALKMATEARI